LYLAERFFRVDQLIDGEQMFSLTTSNS